MTPKRSLIGLAGCDEHCMVIDMARGKEKTDTKTRADPEPLTGSGRGNDRRVVHTIGGICGHDPS